MDDQCWFVVKTNSRAEKLVAERFIAAGIVHYLPIKRELKQWKDRRKWVDEVLIKGYVFVFCTAAERRLVFDVFGVVRFLYFAGKIAVVTQREIEVLQVFCDKSYRHNSSAT